MTSILIKRMEIHVHTSGGLIPAELGEIASAAASAANAATIQANPADVYTPPASGESWPGQGGIYIATVPAGFGLPAHHLIAASVDLGEHAWGPRGEMIEGTGSLYDGAANTRAIIASGKDVPAARAAHNYQEDGHVGYFLPARLDLLHAHAHAANAFEKSGWYWSSTQRSAGTAFAQDFEYGFSDGTSGKYDELRVRPFRRLIIQSL